MAKDSEFELVSLLVKGLRPEVRYMFNELARTANGGRAGKLTQMIIDEVIKKYGEGGIEMLESTYKCSNEYIKKAKTFNNEPTSGL